MRREDLERFLEAGLSLEAIGREVDCHPSTVAYWLRKHGLSAVHADRHAPKGGISRDLLAHLVGSGLTVRDIADDLHLSPTTVRYWLKRHRLRTHRASVARIPRADRPPELTRPCRHHGMAKFVRSKEGHYRCVRCRAERVAVRRRKVKELLVHEAGGQCMLCGYDSYLGALQFHHLDPSEKQFHLGLRGITRSLERMRAEAGKCVLLCSNCHAEVEGGVRSIVL